MNKRLKPFFYLILLVLFACSGDSPDVPDPVASIKLGISPSKDAVVDGKGGELHFSIVAEPVSSQLTYAYSANWIKPVVGKETTWLVEANTSEQSRNGKIYILEASTFAHLDTISIIQKSVNGQISEDPKWVFTESDVPVSIPFAGNSYVTSSEKSSFISNTTGKFSGIWTDKDFVISTYFRVGAAGNLNLAIVGNNVTGSSKIRFTVEGKSYDVSIEGPTSKVYAIAKITRQTEGYIRVDMQGISKTGTTFGDISHFRIGGPASTGTNHYVTEEKMAENESNCYYFRRGASVHYFYTLPEGNTEYFYNEVMVTPENAINGSYYMMNGFSEGYMGIQQTISGERKILFSVWSPYNTDNPEDIPEEKRIKLLRKGANVTIGEFGNEGSGGQSWLNYNWSPGVLYKALVGVKPDGHGNTIYTAYFYVDNTWMLIASFSRPQTSTYYKSAYSFLENFDPVQSYIRRSVSFGNQWARLVSGEWKEVTEAKFSCDDTGKSGMRYDIYGTLDQETNRFVLQSFGFFDEHTTYGTMMRRQLSTTGAPVIDFNMLENISSVN